MIVKAMLKRREYWPPWMSCCEAATRRMLETEFYADVFEVDLGDVDEVQISCVYCKTVYPATKVVRRIRDNRWAPIEMLDIDEGVAA